MNIDRFTIGGRECRVYSPDAYADARDRTAVYVLSGEEFPEEIPELLKPLERKMADGAVKPFVLVCFAPVDWNRDYTPWPAPPLSKKAEPFAGGAPLLLSWLENECMPALAERHQIGLEPQRHLLLGYSLGGLASLWTLYASRRFGGCACCSGSLWYDGWMDFAETREITPNARVYLSLGSGEEKTRNPRMAPIGDVTRGMAEVLSRNENVAQTSLVWHEGGHFNAVLAHVPGIGLAGGRLFFSQMIRQIP